MKSLARARGHRWTSEDDRPRRMRDQLIYRLVAVTHETATHVTLRLRDSVCMLVVTFAHGDVRILSATEVAICRAAAIDRGLGLPLRVEKAR